MKEVIIGNNDAGQRLDRFIAKAVPSLPASLAQKYIRIKRIKIDGKAAKRDQRLLPGQTVTMYINDEFFSAPRSGEEYRDIPDPNLDIVYEDENILLINKPAGVLSHSDEAYDRASALSRIQAYLFQSGQWRPRGENAFAPALCNRLDRNTSGIIVAAKNAEALRIVNTKFKQREIEKRYMAIVHGEPRPASRRLEGHIFKDSSKNLVYMTKGGSPGEKPAVLEYRTISVSGALALLECNLITGRTHQIRAQLADFGHPLLGDGKYGSERLNKPYGEARQALCSYKLVFSFKTDAGALSYLDKSAFILREIPFIKKYFPTIDFLQS